MQVATPTSTIVTPRRVIANVRLETVPIYSRATANRHIAPHYPWICLDP